MSRLKIDPSMMGAVFLCLRKQVEIMEAHGIDYVHVDIKDGR